MSERYGERRSDRETVKGSLLGMKKRTNEKKKNKRIVRIYILTLLNSNASRNLLVRGRGVSFILFFLFRF